MIDRPPYTDWIADEWDRLVRLDSTPEEQEKGWRALYENTVNDGRWVISLWDASLVVYLGLVISWRQERFADAATLALMFHGHPEWKSEERSDMELSCWLGASLLRSGRIDQGGVILRKLIASGSTPATSFVRQSLLWLLRMEESERSHEPYLQRLVICLVATGKDPEQDVDRAYSAKTNGDLLSIIESI